MFMEKIDLPRVTCDLFGATKGFEGSGCGSDKPRAANDAEARAYADFIRRKAGLPDLGSAQMERRPYPNGRGDFYYVGATFGQVLSGGGWEGEAGNRHYVPAQYEPGAFSVLFPGANQMRATVTLETLGEGGEVVSSQTMPVEPKKGGVVWSREDVRKAAGPVAKVKVARTPTRIKRGPTVDKRRRAVLMALRLRKQLRISRDIAHDRLCQLAEISRQNAATRAARPDAPATATDAILSDLAAAQAMMRGEGYVAPTLPRLRAGMRIVLHCASYRGLRATAYHKGTGVGWAAVTDCGRHLTINPDASDVWSPCPTVDEAAPTSGQAKRTPAHERAIRRAWSERCARREAEADAVMWARVAEIRQGKRKAAVSKAMRLARDLATAKQQAIGWQIRFEQERESLQAEVRAGDDRARLAESIAEDHLRMREDLQRLLRAAEARAAAAEAENAQLWAEIEALTAPAAAVAA